jgi:Ca-activated chloride channel family protein
MRRSRLFRFTRPDRGLCFAVCLIAFLVLGEIGAGFAQDEVTGPISPHFKPLSSGAPLLRTRTDLVLVPVTVLDSQQRVVTDLQLDNFFLADNQALQTIKYFSHEDTPLSLTVVLDASGSMATKIEDARRAAIELLKTSNEQDEFGLVVFGDKPRVAVDFTGSADEVVKTVASIQPDGFTSLWDGLYLGLLQQKKASCARRAIVIISDGGDNHSRYSEDEIKSVLKEADVQVYAIGTFDAFLKRNEERMGPLRLDEITSVTGGRMIAVHDPVDIRSAAREISLELRHQYVLGYRPTNRSDGGKWRKIKVGLKETSRRAKLRLYARNGYYGP